MDDTTEPTSPEPLFPDESIVEQACLLIERCQAFYSYLSADTLADATKQAYRNSNNIFMGWVRQSRLSEVSEEVLKKFLQWYQYANGEGTGDKRPDKSIRLMLAALKYRFVKCEKLNESIMPRWKGNETVRKHRYYTDDDKNPFVRIIIELMIK